jgi:ABC-type phosphonate transport system ATPase subunit
MAHSRTILDALSTHEVLIIVGETGSGKTTQLPQLLLPALPAQTGELLLLQTFQPLSFLTGTSRRTAEVWSSGTPEAPG